VLAPLSQLAVTRGQFLGNGLEGRGVGLVAGIDVMEERDMEIGAHQHAQADLAQVAPVLLVMAAGGQVGRRAGVDEGEEVGAIVDQGAQGQV